MNDSQLLHRLGAANAYPVDVDVPEQIWTRDLALRELDRRISMDTKQQTPVATAPKARRRGPLVAAAAFAITVLAIAGFVIIAVVDDPTPVATSEDAAALIGTTATVTGGNASSLPDSIQFDADGTFRVVTEGDAVDHGTYHTDGDLLSFVSELEFPEWVVFGTSNFISSANLDKCDGVAGDYRVVFQEPTRLTLHVVWDECGQRVNLANGLQLELRTG